MEDLSDYLRSRHVPEEDIQRMEQDTVDSSVIHLMTDDQLREYLPSYGDRRAVLGYCRRKEKPSSRKSKIFKRLRGKLSRDDHVPERKHQTLSKSAQKNLRKIDSMGEFQRRGICTGMHQKGRGNQKREYLEGQKEKYLPVKLAHVLLEQAVLGFVESDLVDCFFKYVSEPERAIFESCSDFESVDLQELLEIMDIHNCQRLPTADSIEKILRELAYQKLIQEPAFVIEQWSNMLAPVRSELKGIAAVYEELQPTSRDQTCSQERTSLSTSYNLRDFREDLLPTHDGCYLELPVSYDNYPDFQHELTKF